MTPFIGQIMTVGFNFAPRDWAFCAGQTMSIAQNNALYALIGTTYGGDGVTTFKLPDLRGRAVMGQGQGPGLSPRVMGEASGAEQQTLNSATMPAHVHFVMSQSGHLNAVDVIGTEQSPQSGGYLARGTDSAVNPDMIPLIYIPAASGGSGTSVPLAGINVAGNTDPVGSSVPFSTMQPYTTLNQCIALFGIFPSRN